MRVFSEDSAAYYDASSGLIYTGTTPDDALLNFQKNALSGFYVTDYLTLNGNNVRAMIIRPIDKTELQLVAQDER